MIKFNPLSYASFDFVNDSKPQSLYFYGKASGKITKGDGKQFGWVQGDHILLKTSVVSEIQANPTYFIGIATKI